jgi:hypothetical protein
MRAYTITTGIVFALLTVAHLWRIVGEQRSLATQPEFVAITLAAATLSVWAFVTLRRSSRP